MSISALLDSVERYVTTIVVLLFVLEKEKVFNLFVNFKISCSTMPVMLLSHVWVLTVFTQNGSQPMETKWTKSTNQGDIWIQIPGIDLKLDP